MLVVAIIHERSNVPQVPVSLIFKFVKSSINTFLGIVLQSDLDGHSYINYVTPKINIGTFLLDN